MILLPSSGRSMKYMTVGQLDSLLFFRFPGGVKYFSFHKNFRHNLGPTQPGATYVAGDLALVVKRPLHESDELLNLVSILSISGGVTLLPITPSWCAQGQLHVRS
jgi:hypothetical protein